MPPDKSLQAPAGDTAHVARSASRANAPASSTAGAGSPNVFAETPTPDEYIALRIAAGLSPKSIQAASKGLPNSLFAACIRIDDRLVAMGRVVGDGGCNFEIVDIAVHPDYQRQGLGSRIMQSLMDYLRQHAPESAYVSLIADEGAENLYRRFGFEFTAPDSVGMAIRL
jgi:ribosomal protein S18 acetylase RimI-like enzyme